MKDGSVNFTHAGIYNEIKTHQLIRYTDDEGRKSTITFAGSNPVLLIERFEPEPTLSLEMQQNFCQGILNNFKRYTEATV